MKGVTKMEISNPLVSVIVPVYKVEQYLPRCLDSLAAQTLASIEIIVVDDGSPDACGAIADDYARRFGNIRVVHQENGGRGAARNSGLAVARGKYVGFADSDDFVEPSMYEEMSRALEEDGRAELAMCGAQVEYTYDAPEKDVQAMRRYFEVPGEGGVDLSVELVMRLNATCWAYLYRRDFLERNGIRFPVGVEGEDEVLFFQVFAYATRIHFVPHQLYHYLLNEQGTMAQQPREFKESGKLPDLLTKDAPLLFAFLERVDRRDLIGLVYRKLSWISTRYESERVLRIVSRFLRDTHFAANREFIGGPNFARAFGRLSAIAKYPPSDETFPLVNEDLLPPPRAPIPAVEKPLLSYVVPVYNAADYLAVCIDSLRRQTLGDIEMIFVDDGSTDGSSEILAEAAQRDGRIRVIHQANAGVGAARNRGMDEAKGKYLAFVDGDDYLDLHAAEDTVALCEKHDLDFCLFDFICFNYKTREGLNHGFYIRKHPEIPWERVFVPRELSSWNFHCAIWTGVFRRSFLVAQKIHFSELKLGEDFCVFFRLLAGANRVYVIPRVFYHYRRGNPLAAISQFKMAGAGTQGARDAQVLFVKACASLLDECSARLPAPAFAALMRRCYRDIIGYAEENSAVVALMRGECRQALRVDDQTEESLGRNLYFRLINVLHPLLGRIRNRGGLIGRIIKCYYDEGFWYTLKRMLALGRKDSKVSRLLCQVGETRQKATQDLYLVVAALSSKTSESIDSWTFFCWLQERGIPSRYLVSRDHSRYAKIVQEGRTKDVVVLAGSGRDNEILLEHSDLLCRAKAVVQEEYSLNRELKEWLYKLPGCERVLLRHGIGFWKLSHAIVSNYSMFNSVNVSSVREKELLESVVPVSPVDGKMPRFFVAGLARFDQLKDEREAGRTEFVLFVMFTWRRTFAKNPERIDASAYSRCIREFLSSENMLRLKQCHVRVVVALHNALASRGYSFSFCENVEMVSTDNVSYWIRHADACLTDYSSVAFDFAFLHKPTIYWIPDVGDPMLNESDRGEIEIARHQAKDFYNVETSAEGAIKLIEFYAQRNFVLEPEKCAISDTFFAYRKDVCQHVYESIEEIIKERQMDSSRNGGL